MTHPARRMLLSLSLLALLALSGCATTKELDAMRADIEAANQRAAAAEAAANKAQSSADAAAAAAQRAEQAANEAKAAARATDEKIDRMFKEAMKK